MFKFIRKKLLEGIVKDIIGKIPEIKDYAHLFFEQHKDEILEKVKDAIKKVIKDFVVKKLK